MHYNINSSNVNISEWKQPQNIASGVCADFALFKKVGSTIYNSTCIYMFR